MDGLLVYSDTGVNTTTYTDAIRLMPNLDEYSFQVDVTNKTGAALDMDFTQEFNNKIYECKSPPTASDNWWTAYDTDGTTNLGVIRETVTANGTWGQFFDLSAATWVRVKITVASGEADVAIRMTKKVGV